jgi:hypothetical protein
VALVTFRCADCRDDLGGAKRIAVLSDRHGRLVLEGRTIVPDYFADQICPYQMWAPAQRRSCRRVVLDDIPDATGKRGDGLIFVGCPTCSATCGLVTVAGLHGYVRAANIEPRARAVIVRRYWGDGWTLHEERVARRIPLGLRPRETPSRW